MSSYPLLNVQTGINWDISANNVTLVSLNGNGTSGQYLKSNGTSAPSFAIITQSTALNNLYTPFYPNSKSYDVSGGIIAQTCDPTLCNTTNTLILNRGYFQSVYLYAGSVLKYAITGLQSVTSSGSELWQFALYKGDGTRLAATNPAGVAYSAAGNYVIPFYSGGVNTPYTVPTSGFYYLAVVILAGNVPLIFSTGGVVISTSVINYPVPSSTTSTTGNLSLFRMSSVASIPGTGTGFPASLSSGYTITGSPANFYLALS